MSKFNKRVTNVTTNLAGGKAFSMKPQEELIHAVMSTFLENKPYESGDDRVKRIASLVAQCAPEFVARLAVVARKEYHMRSVVTVLLGELAKIHRGDDLVKRAIVAATVRVDDLTELVSYLGTPLPKQVKRGIRNAILKFSPYQLAKYKGDGKAVSLIDVFNLTHPKVQHATEEQKKAWEALMTGKLVSFDTWETELSNSTDKKASLERLIMENKMGYMAMLRNLNNFVKYGISEVATEKVIAKLTDPEEVKKSKQLPFRFITAYENVKGNRKYTDAISVAMDLAVSNTPKLDGRTLVAIDSSGSMMSGALDKCAPLGATLSKTNDVDLILFDTSVKELRISSLTPVVDIVENIKRNAQGGGTNTSLVFQYAYGKKYDRIIILSDNESWAGGGWGRKSSTQEAYSQYRKTNGDPFVYAIDVQGYGTKDISSPKVKHLCGWSDRILDFVGASETNLLQHILSVEIYGEAVR